jgi:hypothetical protein
VYPTQVQVQVPVQVRRLHSFFKTTFCDECFVANLVLACQAVLARRMQTCFLRAMGSEMEGGW